MVEALEHIGRTYELKPGGDYERVSIQTESGREIAAYVGNGFWKGFSSTDAAIRAFGAMGNPAFIFVFDNDANALVFNLMFGSR